MKVLPAPGYPGNQWEGAVLGSQDSSPGQQQSGGEGGTDEEGTQW